MKLLLASRNPGKLREFKALFPGFTLVPWPSEAPELPETGAFFSASPSATHETSGLNLGSSGYPSSFTNAGAP